MSGKVKPITIYSCSAVHIDSKVEDKITTITLEANYELMPHTYTWFIVYIFILKMKVHVVYTIVDVFSFTILLLACV